MQQRSLEYDGVNRQQANKDILWLNRQFREVAVFDNKMWVLEGFRLNYNMQSDVWKITRVPEGSFQEA